MSVRALRLTLTAAILIGSVVPCGAQVTPAQTITPPDDTPSIRVGATIFTDYTVQTEPKITDADGNAVNLVEPFNVGRAYLNVTGNINHHIAFRITPDITRGERAAGSRSPAATSSGSSMPTSSSIWTTG